MTRAARLLGVGAAACVIVPPALGAGTPILLPSVRTTLTPGPPLTASNVSGEVLYPPGMTSDQKVLVGVDSTGKPVSVRVLQRLELRKLGDYSFVVPGPVIDVEAAPGSQSEPGLRRDAILWAGFSSGHKTLASLATLRPGAASSRLPFRLSLSREGDTLVVRGQNMSTAHAPVLVGPLSVKEADNTLRQTKKYVQLGVSAPDLYAKVTRTPKSKSETIVAPLDVRGQVGESSFHYVLGDGRPLDFEHRVEHAPANAKLRVVVTPVPPERLLRTRVDNPQNALHTVSKVRLTVARALQYQTFLVNPNPTGRSKAVYVYETAKRTAASAPTATSNGGGSSTWPTYLAIALGVLGAGALVVVWAHS